MPAKKRKITKVARSKKKVRAMPASPTPEESLGASAIVGPEGIDSDPFISNYLLSWQAPEFIYHPKSFNWHIFAASFIVILVGASLYLKEWIAATVFIILGFLIFRYAEVKPRTIEIGLTNVGIKVGNVFYPYNKLKSFWLVYEPPIKTLNLETTRRFSPIIAIQLEDTDPFLVKNILKEHLLEESERTEDLIDRFSRFLRF